MRLLRRRSSLFAFRNSENLRGSVMLVTGREGALPSEPELRKWEGGPILSAKTLRTTLGYSVLSCADHATLKWN